jgi:hypothetical protein
MIGRMLHEALQRDDLSTLRREATRINQRKEQARFYRWKERNRLPPLRKQLAT